MIAALLHLILVCAVVAVAVVAYLKGLTDGVRRGADALDEEKRRGAEALAQQKRRGAKALDEAIEQCNLWMMQWDKAECELKGYTHSRTYFNRPEDPGVAASRDKQAEAARKLYAEKVYPELAKARAEAGGASWDPATTRQPDAPNEGAQ